MTRQKLPDNCDFCGKEIQIESNQYVLELFQGRSTFGNQRIRAKNKCDMCHKCFLDMAKIGYKPDFIKEQKNPQWVSGSKLASEKYFIAVEDPPTQEVLTS